MHLPNASLSFYIFFWSYTYSNQFLLAGSGHYHKIAADQHDIRTDPRQDLRIKDPCIAHDLRQDQGRSRAHDKLCQAGNHGKHRISHPLYDRPYHMQDIEDRQADAHDGQVTVGHLQRRVKFLRRP